MINPSLSDSIQNKGYDGKRILPSQVDGSIRSTPMSSTGAEWRGKSRQVAFVMKHCLEI